VAGPGDGERARRGGGLARHAGVRGGRSARGRAAHRSWSMGSRLPPRSPGSCWNASTRCARADSRRPPTARCRSRSPTGTGD
jgi:hypothetical protein